MSIWARKGNYKAVFDMEAGAGKAPREGKLSGALK